MDPIEGSAGQQCRKEDQAVGKRSGGTFTAVKECDVVRCQDIKRKTNAMKINEL